MISLNKKFLRDAIIITNSSPRAKKIYIKKFKKIKTVIIIIRCINIYYMCVVKCMTFESYIFFIASSCSIQNKMRSWLCADLKKNKCNIIFLLFNALIYILLLLFGAPFNFLLFYFSKVLAKQFCFLVAGF